MNYERLFLEQLHVIEEAVKYVGRRYHLSADELQELAADIRVKIISDNYAVLRKFEGRSSLRTYLVTVVHRHFLSARVAAWGRWRPSMQAQRLGPVAVKLDQLLTRDGLSLDEAIQALGMNGQVPSTEAELRDLAAQLPTRTRRTMLQGSDHLAELEDPAPGPDAVFARAAGLTQADRIDGALRAALEELAPDDRLIVRLHFYERMKLAQIARLLQRAQKPLYKQLERIMDGLRRTMKSRGVDEALVLTLVGDPELELRPVLSTETESRSRQEHR